MSERNHELVKTQKYDKIISSLPDDFSKFAVYFGVALIPAYLLTVIALPIRVKVDFVGVAWQIVGQFWYLWAAGLLLLLAGSAYYISYRLQHRRLQILDIGAEGITLGRMEDNATEEFKYQVTWREIDSAKEISAHHGKSWLYIYSSIGVVFKISGENAFRWISREEFVDGFIKNAPNAELSLAGDGPGTIMRDLTYTSLWLEELDATGRRKRLRPLDGGDKVGDGAYEVVRQIGAGGQGRAYLARAKDKNSPAGQREHVVLKEYILPTRADASKGQTPASNYYLDEALILNLLDHKGIMKIYDSFEEDYNGYLVLEYVEGSAMRGHVSAHGACPEPQAVRIAIELCDILIYMHGLKPAVIHGDVTPENIIVEPGGQVKLIDFTVAHKFLNERKSRLSGKQGYVAPEQFSGQTLPQSDIYALGCTLWFLLSGFDFESIDEEEAQARPKELWASTALKMIVEKCMAEDLNERYKSAEELKRDLTAYAIH